VDVSLKAGQNSRLRLRNGRRCNRYRNTFNGKKCLSTFNQFCENGGLNGALVAQTVARLLKKHPQTNLSFSDNRLTKRNCTVELSEIYQKGKENLSQRDGKCPIIVDGGFRRGSDVAKGLAFGANLVGLGRPILYGLAADGKNGVRDLILQITAELKRIMSILGAARAGEMDRGMLILGNA
jgi:hypothetical protein